MVLIPCLGAKFTFAIPAQMAQRGGGLPLEGIVIVDLTRILSGPWCTHILCDLGARIIKVEPPQGGDDTRRLGHLMDVEEADHPSLRSAYFPQPNCGKESIALDLKSTADREVFEALLAKADALVENYRPGVMQRLGYEYESLHAKFPTLVMCSVSGFGQTGPAAPRGAVDTIIQAMSGMISVTGNSQEGSEPTRCGVSVSDMMAGMYAANGVQAALLGRQRTGEGCHVDILMLDVSVAAASVQIGQYGATGVAPKPIGNRNPVATPFDVFLCKEGSRICISGAKDANFRTLCEKIGRGDLAAEERYQTNRSRTQHADELRPALEAGLASKTASDWERELLAEGIPCGQVNTISETVAHEQVQARNMALKTENGRFLVSGSPFKMSGYDEITARPDPPVLDSDRESILAFAFPSGARRSRL